MKYFHPPRLSLAHPISVGAIVVLMLNDHVFKQHWPSPITGKLSDVAGLMFFPLLMIAIVDVIIRPGWRHLPLVAVTLTGFCFSLIQIWGPAADFYRTGLGWIQWPFRFAIWGAEGPTPVHHTADPNDLLALPALALSWWLASRKPTKERGAADPPSRRQVDPSASPERDILVSEEDDLVVLS